MSHLFVFWLVESSIVCYFISDKQRCATPIRSLDDDCSAGRSYRRAWRASNRRPHTHATSIFSLSYNPSFPSMKYVAEKVLERALTFTRFFYMNRNSGLTTLSGSSIAVRACPRHRAVRAPRGTKHDGGSLRLQNEYSKSARQLWSAVRGQRENQSFILCSANTWAAFLRECARVLLWANSMIFQKVGLKIISAPLSLSYVKSVSPWWKSDRIRRWPIPRVDEEKYCRRNFLHRLGTIDLIIVWLHSVC